MCGFCSCNKGGLQPLVLSKPGVPDPNWWSEFGWDSRPPSTCQVRPYQQLTASFMGRLPCNLASWPLLPASLAPGFQPYRNSARAGWQAGWLGGFAWEGPRRLARCLDPCNDWIPIPEKSSARSTFRRRACWVVLLAFVTVCVWSSDLATWMAI